MTKFTARTASRNDRALLVAGCVLALGTFMPWFGQFRWVQALVIQGDGATYEAHQFLGVGATYGIAVLPWGPIAFLAGATVAVLTLRRPGMRSSAVGCLVGAVLALTACGIASLSAVHGYVGTLDTGVDYGACPGTIVADQTCDAGLLVKHGISYVFRFGMYVSAIAALVLLVASLSSFASARHRGATATRQTDPASTRVH